MRGGALIYLEKGRLFGGVKEKWSLSISDRSSVNIVQGILNIHEELHFPPRGPRKSVTLMTLGNALALYRLLGGR